MANKQMMNLLQTGIFLLGEYWLYTNTPQMVFLGVNLVVIGYGGIKGLLKLK